MRKVNTVRFGEIDVDEKKILHFKEGIPAFEKEHEFLLIPFEDDSPFFFMQSLKSPDLAFLVTSPFIFFPDYSFEIDDDIMKEFDIKAQEDLMIYSILTVPNGEVKKMTANLMAPVVINSKNMQGKQVVLDKSPYQTKHLLFPEKEGA
ncbi:MAG: flagellar assembly protein FliW [Selenomonadaceae bacterium]|nr:flagellar assembly protein FliW [Selenomonadaceae bacterium]MBP3722926.1 flagellar assembly protein FliW [Selenomonadaceae bacterium]